MNLYLDTAEEFAATCCALPQAADRRGPVCADLLVAGESKQGHDRQTRAWLEALASWTAPADVREALIAENATIIETGRTYYALLADVALALVEGLHDTALLARIQPNFPGIDLVAMEPEVRATEVEHQQAVRRSLDHFLASYGKDKDGEKYEPEPKPPEPLRRINPDDPPELRATALIWQLLRALDDPLADVSLLAYWSLNEQPGPIARFLEEYYRFDSPQDLPSLIARQREAAERSLELKLALLQDTLAGIVSRGLRNSLAHMASHFDGDLPGFELVRWLHEPKPADPAKTLRLDAMEGSDRWRIACDGTSAVIGEADAQVLSAALDRLLHQEPETQNPALADTFKTCLAALTKLDDHAFQAFLREIQSVTLALILAGLPEHRRAPPDFDDVHPFYRMAERNVSSLAWEMIENDAIRLGSAPLDAFELAEVLGVLGKIQPNLFPQEKHPSFLQRIFGSVEAGKPPPLELPDRAVSQGIALIERFPRQATLVIGEAEAACRWKVNIDEIRLFACQLHQRNTLRDGETSYIRAWAADWLSDLATQPLARRQRFLRGFTVAEADLLFRAAPPDSRPNWLDACSPVVRARFAATIGATLAEERHADLTRLIISHEMFSYRPVY